MSFPPVPLPILLRFWGEQVGANEGTGRVSEYVIMRRVTVQATITCMYRSDERRAWPLAHDDHMYTAVTSIGYSHWLVTITCIPQ